MNTMRNRFKALGLTMAAALLLGACMAPLTPIDRIGTLWISVDSASIKTVLPSLDTSTVSYEVTGVGPDSQTFTSVSDSADVVLDNLVEGTWTITVNALNSSGVTVGSGSADAVVYTGQITPLSLIILPLDGMGALSVALSWTAEMVVSPAVSATLTDSTGTENALAFSIGPDGTATCSRSDVEDGYYTLTVNLLDNSTVVAGMVEIVRVLSGETTTFDYLFESVNPVEQEYLITAESFAIAWDPPTSGTVTSYNVYYRPTGTTDWLLLGTADATATPSLTIDTSLLAYGQYEFAVTSVDDTATESDKHTSCDTSAMPCTGWFVNWTGPQP